MECLKLLKEIEFKDNQPFWEIFKLIELVFLEGRIGVVHEASRRDVLLMLDTLQKAKDKHSVVGKNWAKTWQLLAHEQFVWQGKCVRNDFGRQLLLFVDPPKLSAIRTTFKNEHGFELDQCIQMLFYTYCYVNLDMIDNTRYYPKYLAPDYDNVCTEVYGDGIVEKFKRFISLPEKDLSKVLRDRKGAGEVLDLFNNRFLSRYPLINLAGRTYPFHRDTFNYSGKYFIYDYLKDKYQNSFTEVFGKIFENHIAECMSEIGLNYIREGEIKNRYQVKTKPDFLYEECVMIECKAIEATYHSQVDPSDSKLMNSYKGSIIKAITKQFAELSNKLVSENQFGLIITYKELYIGSCASELEHVLENSTEYEAKSNLPLHNIFLMDLATWDKIAFLIKNNQTELIPLLKEIKELSGSKETKKFTFDMYLHEMFENEEEELKLEYLDKANDRILPL